MRGSKTISRNHLREPARNLPPRPSWSCHPGYYNDAILCTKATVVIDEFDERNVLIVL